MCVCVCMKLLDDRYIYKIRATDKFNNTQQGPPGAT